MQNFELIAEGREVIPIKVPTSWQEVTLGQFIDLKTRLDMADGVAIVAYMAGVDVEMVKRISFEDFQYILNCLAFLEDPIPANDFKDPMMAPAIVMQMQAAQTRFAANGQGSGYLLYPFSYAIYMQRHIDGEYKGERVALLEEEVKGKPVTEVLQACAFFFSRLSNFFDGMNREKRILSRPSRKTIRQVLRSWVKGLGSSLQ